ncbi:unnamed protein product [Coffea canephora]|uniref:Uncharacterized protein n=1 Tax=Coffea canephora TaxID=49390 RepID=A0A068V9A1_COFCA|nr:unnamed protein product [Coffea canephora]
MSYFWIHHWGGECSKAWRMMMAGEKGDDGVVVVDVRMKDRNFLLLLIFKPLADATLHGHRDICRILEVNGDKDSTNDHSMTIRREEDSYEVNIDMFELKLQHSSMIEQAKSMSSNPSQLTELQICNGI